jgi:GH15 family glucan-1,4-alpha-glucosidase
MGEPLREVAEQAAVPRFVLLGAWLLRVAAGDPSRLQIMYGIDGERRLTESELDWLPGYAESRPARIGNGAWNQFQIDVYGELLDMMYEARRLGAPEAPETWEVFAKLLRSAP